MALIAIIGASSGLGLATVQEALNAGHEVRAFARTASDIRIVSERLQKVPGDALSERDVSTALTGVDAVVQTLGVPFDTRLLLGPITLFSEATALLIPAMQAAEVRRLVAVTGFGAGDSRARIGMFQRPGFELLFGRAYRDKSEQERLIRESDLDWTIVRPGMLTNGKRTTYGVLSAPDTWRNGVVSRAGVARFIVDRGLQDDAVHTTPVLVGRA